MLTAGDGRYVANEQAALATLTRESLVELRPDVLTFLMLPRSGEALAFEHKQGRTAPPQIHRLDPVVSAPVPYTYRDATRTAMLRTMIEARQVADLPEDVVEIAEPEGEQPVPDVCPAYRYAGRLRLCSGQVRATGHIYGERGEDRVPLDLSSSRAASSTTGATRPNCSTWRKCSRLSAGRSAARPLTRQPAARAPRTGRSKSAPPGPGISPGEACACAAPAASSCSAQIDHQRSRW